MKSIFFSIFICVLILPFYSFSQGLTGVVKNDYSGRPIDSVLVSIPSLDTKTFTNNKGEFSFNSVLSNYDLAIEKKGFKSQLIHIEGEKHHIEILLEPEELQLNEIVVTYEGPISHRNLPAHLEVIDMEELKSIPSASMGDLISGIPGVDNASSGPGVSKPVIRGFSGTRIVSVLNGIRLENQQWGGDHGLGVTELGIGKVEVIKGPSSLMYGADALGGVIFYSDESYVNSNEIDLNLESRYESATNGLTNSIMYKDVIGSTRVKIGFRSNDHGDFKAPNGHFAANTRYNDRAAKLALGRTFKKGVLDINYSYFNSKVGIPGAHEHHEEGEEEEEEEEHDEIFLDEQERFFETPFQFYENHYASIKYNTWINKNKFTVIAGQTIADLKEFEESFTEAAMNSRLSNTLLNFTWRRTIGKNGILYSGYQGSFQMNRNRENPEEILIHDANQMDNAIFVIFNQKINKWNWQTGIRYDSRLIEAFLDDSNDRKDFHAINFALGGSYFKNARSFKFNFSSGVRMPHLSELYSEGAHHGALRYEIGSSALKPENGYQLDVSFEHSGEHIGLVLNPFISAFNNYISLESMDSIIDELPVYKYVQTDNVYMTGGEFGLHYHPHFVHDLHFESVFAVVLAEIDRSPLDFIPQSNLKNTINYQLPEFNEDVNISIVLQHAYFLPQNRVGEFETSTVDYHLINLGLKFDIGRKTRFKVDLGVRNILNETYFNHLSRLKRIGIPSVGRNIYAGLKVEI